MACLPWPVPFGAGLCFVSPGPVGLSPQVAVHLPPPDSCPTESRTFLSIPSSRGKQASDGLRTLGPMSILPFPGRVTLGLGLAYSEPRFLHLEDGRNKEHTQVLALWSHSTVTAGDLPHHSRGIPFNAVSVHPYLPCLKVRLQLPGQVLRDVTCPSRRMLRPP